MSVAEDEHWTVHFLVLAGDNVPAVRRKVPAFVSGNAPEQVDAERADARLAWAERRVRTVNKPPADHWH